MYYGPDGTDYNLEQYAQLNGLSTEAVVGQYTFKPDGTVDVATGDGNSVSGTYKADAKSVTVTLAGVDGLFQLDADGTLLNDNSASGLVSVRLVNNQVMTGGAQ
jgi:hypothetical protein